MYLPHDDDKTSAIILQMQLPEEEPKQTFKKNTDFSKFSRFFFPNSLAIRSNWLTWHPKLCYYATSAIKKWTNMIVSNAPAVPPWFTGIACAVQHFRGRSTQLSVLNG